MDKGGVRAQGQSTRRENYKAYAFRKDRGHSFSLFTVVSVVVIAVKLRSIACPSAGERKRARHVTDPHVRYPGVHAK